MIFHTYGNNNTDVIVLIHGVMELREKYDLHMTAERFISEDTGSDEKYIRK